MTEPPSRFPFYICVSVLRVSRLPWLGGWLVGVLVGQLVKGKMGDGGLQPCCLTRAGRVCQHPNTTCLFVGYVTGMMPTLVCGGRVTIWCRQLIGRMYHTKQPINQPNNQSINQPSNRSIHQSIHQLTNQSIS